jgi:hypothetical protein
VEQAQIWELILKADERLKYAAGSQDGLRQEQAAGFLLEALQNAEAGGFDALAEQARTRLADLDHQVSGD